jgi:hypothetical protein
MIFSTADNSLLNFSSIKGDEDARLIDTQIKYSLHDDDFQIFDKPFVDRLIFNRNLNLVAKPFIRLFDKLKRKLFFDKKSEDFCPS